MLSYLISAPVQTVIIMSMHYFLVAKLLAINVSQLILPQVFMFRFVFIIWSRFSFCNSGRTINLLYIRMCHPFGASSYIPCIILTILPGAPFFIGHIAHVFSCPACSLHFSTILFCI